MNTGLQKNFEVDVLIETSETEKGLDIEQVMKLVKENTKGLITFGKDGLIFEDAE